MKNYICFQNCPFIYVDLNLTLLKFTRINMNFLWVPCSFPHISCIPMLIDSWKKKKKKNKYKSFFFLILGDFKICCQIRVSPIMEKPNTWINSAMKYPSEPGPRKVHKHTTMFVDIFEKFYKGKKKKKLFFYWINCVFGSYLIHNISIWSITFQLCQFSP